jgi:hypothetical protein
MWCCIWTWIKAHDLPNWVTLIIGLFVWPVIVILWNRRMVHGVPGLEVSILPGNVNVRGVHFPAIDVQFINSTGSIVYITGPRVRINAKTLRVPKEADRDIGTGALYFAAFESDTDPVTQATVREFTLQTNKRRHGAITLADPPPDDLYTYKTPLWRRLLKHPKYFRLEYSAMVGRKARSIVTIF